jgi:EAL domain-containing protein (putative c-di-GMP-specific phosphodiesterase class I)
LGRTLKSADLSTAFQPIVSLEAAQAGIHALECLTRGPAGTGLEAPGTLCALAHQSAEESVLDRACLVAALGAAGEVAEHVSLSLNVHAATLSKDAEFCRFLGDTAQAASIGLSRLIVEIAQCGPSPGGTTFVDSLDALRHMGIRIALDDVGLGHWSYGLILECRPDYLKIDRCFVTGVHGDYYREAIVDSIAHLADRIGARVVAEGVEREEDLDCLRRLGLGLAQGLLFSRPMSGPELPIGLRAARFPRPCRLDEP